MRRGTECPRRRKSRSARARLSTDRRFSSAGVRSGTSIDTAHHVTAGAASATCLVAHCPVRAYVALGSLDRTGPRRFPPTRGRRDRARAASRYPGREERPMCGFAANRGSEVSEHRMSDGTLGSSWSRKVRHRSRAVAHQEAGYKTSAHRASSVRMSLTVKQAQAIWARSLLAQTIGMSRSDAAKRCVGTTGCR